MGFATLFPNITSSTRCINSGCKGRPIRTKSSASMLGCSNKDSSMATSRPVCKASHDTSWPSSCSRSRKKWPAWKLSNLLLMPWLFFVRISSKQIHSAICANGLPASAVFEQESEKHKEKARESCPIAYPVLRGSRIAYHPKISNTDAHANGYTYNSIYTTMSADYCFIVRMVLNLRDSKHRK